MKISKILLPLFLIFLSQAAHSEYKWGFANMSLNYLDWDKGTETKSTKTDFTYLELEGFGQHSWGEIYGFFDIENIAHTGDEVRTASKGVLRYYLGQSNFSIYAHEYSFMALGFSEQNRVLGLGYQLAGDGWWFKPFLGFHEVTQTFFNGMNGYMGGWVIGYSFKVCGQSFLLVDWHELEFDRKEAYAAQNGGNKTAHNGAASAWWDATKDVTLGLQWRYATDKLGTQGAMNAVISSLRYNF